MDPEAVAADEVAIEAGGEVTAPADFGARIAPAVAIVLC